MTTSRIAGAALAVAVLLSAAVSGCAVKVQTGGSKAISAADLQKDLTERLAKAGNTPQSVTCAGDLPAEVGKTATCEVVLSDTNSVQADVTATKVEGSTVDFTYAPSLTREQLQKAVKGLASAEAVTCDAGLAGKVDATAKCQIVRDGTTTTDTIVTATKVDGLSIDFSVAAA